MVRGKKWTPTNGRFRVVPLNHGLDRKGKPLTEEDLLLLRQQLLEHRDNFVTLLDALKSA